MLKPLVVRLALGLALLAVLARAAIPAGYMPDFSRDAFQMVICTLEGSKKITVDGNFNPVEPAHNKNVSNLCDFSLVKNLSLEASGSAFFAFSLMILGMAYIVMRSQIARRALRLPNTQSRAPPFFSF